MLPMYRHNGRVDRLVRILILVALSVTSIVSYSCRGRPPKHAIILLLDAARPDRFSCYGYRKPTTPNIDSLAAEGWVFENHYAQATATREALPTLLYSRYFAQPMFPMSQAVPLSEPNSLFRRPDKQCISLPKALHAEGFITAAISAHLWIKRGTAFADEFDELHDLCGILETGDIHPDAQQMVQHAIQWIESNRDARFLLYLHFMDTHFPHSMGENAQDFLGRALSGKNRFDSWGRPGDIEEPLTEEERTYLNALYDGSLSTTDREIGKLVEFLRSKRMLDRTLIAITADHGEHLLEHPGRFEHGGPWFDMVARIPLVLFCPSRLDQQRIESMTESIDLFPTILSLLDVTLPAGKTTDGIDLTSAESPSHTSREYVFARNGIRGGRYKCLLPSWKEILDAEHAPHSDGTPKALYDLHVDSLETNDVSTRLGEISQLMVQQFLSHMKKKYERYVGAVSHDQPRSSFAIRISDFELDTNPVILGTPLTRAVFREWRSHQTLVEILVAGVGRG